MKHTLNLFRRPAAAVVGMAFAALTMISCVKEVEVSSTHKGDDSREMVFQISVSGSTPDQTRAIAENSTNDNAINDLLFLQFGSDGKLLPGAGGYSIISANLTPKTGTDAPVANTYTVKVSLHVDAKKAIVMANWGKFKGGTSATDYLISSLQGKTIAQVAESDLFYYDAYPANKDFTDRTAPFHLMGSQPFDIPAVGTVTTVPLSRSLAKVNVTVSNNLTVKGGNGSGGTLMASDGFKLKTIQLVNVNRNARVFPPVLTTAGAQNIPTNSGTFAGGSAYEKIVYGTAQGLTVKSFMDGIFLPETKISGNPDNFTGSDWKTAPTLLIQATLNSGGTDVDRWFRVNLRMADTSDGGKLKHVDILRNHKYTVNITGIGGMGYASAQEAYDALPDDLIVNRGGR